MRICTKCKETKSHNEFRKINSHCRTCERAWHARNYINKKDKILAKNAEWRKANPKEVIKHARNALLRQYGITQDQYDAFLVSQGYKCAICESIDAGRKTSKQFLVDHCHKTGRVRGLLCHKCNAAIGMLKESRKILEKAIEYLK